MSKQSQSLSLSDCHPIIWYDDEQEPNKQAKTEEKRDEEAINKVVEEAAKKTETKESDVKTNEKSA